MATITASKQSAESGMRSKDELRQALLSADFSSLLLKNASAELDLGGKVVKGFIAKAQEYAGSSTGLDRLKLLTEFVYKQIPYDIEKQGNPLFEDMLAGKSGGVCLHKAAALQLVLVYEGFDVRSEGGIITFNKNIMLGSHSWLSADIDGVKYLSDPTNMLIGKYQEFDIRTVATGFLRKQITERYGPFNVLRREKVGLEKVYEDFWNWDAARLKYERAVPEAFKKATDTIAPFYAKFTETLDNLTTSRERRTGEIIGITELEVASAYSMWASASLIEVDQLNKLVKASNLDLDQIHI